METFAFRVKDQHSCLLETRVKKVPKSESPNHYILSTGLIFPAEGFFFVASRLAGFRRFPLKNEQVPSLTFEPADYRCCRASKSKLYVQLDY